MKEWTITEIQNLSEKEAQEMAVETMDIKEHNIYFIDFEGYFGYSSLVFKNNHHIHYANDYELHHKGKSKAELRELFIKEMNDKLFTDAEIAQPLKDYNEYTKKSDYLHNYYGMQVDSISIFCVNPTKEQQKEFERQTKSMIYNPIAFAYMYDENFVKHHIHLAETLIKAQQACENDYEYQKTAFLYEMYNHEYGINWQADYDTLSSFGNIGWHDGDINAYFEELKFTDLQKKAYLDARKQYFKEQSEGLY